MSNPLTARDHRSPMITTIRDLVPNDIEHLRLQPTSPRLKSIRDSHHAIARLIAAGKSIKEICELTGSSYSRISVLKNDPSFAELVNHYRSEVKEIWREHIDAMAEIAVSNMIKAERQIGDALDAADDEGAAPIPLRDLARITADRMDRFGYGKHTTSTNINVGFAARLEAAIQRSRRVEE